jgi:hypothetical protein
MSAMTARETELKPATAPAAPEVAPAEPAAGKTEFKSEGDLPAVAKTSATAGPASASDQAFGQPDAAKSEQKIDRGMHIHADDYRASCEAAGKPEKWKDQYRNGHTDAKGWIQPYERYKVYLEWQLQHGASASKAIQDFIKGPTICDYRTAAVAHDIDKIRDELGDQKFDKLFGSANSSEDAAIPVTQRLQITPAMYGIPLVDQMRAIAKAADAKNETQPEEETPAVEQEARVEEKPKADAQEPVVVAQELGLQADREMV